MYEKKSRRVNARKIFSVFLTLALLIGVFHTRLMLVPSTVYGTPPEITILSPENTTYTTSSVPLTFVIKEETSWIGYSLDNKENMTIVGNITLTGLHAGEHSIIIYANYSSGDMGSSDKVYFTISVVNDVAVVNVDPIASEICVGEAVSINVTVENEGTIDESFNVTAYYDTSVIEQQTVINLTAGATATLIFHWNTSNVPIGSRIVKAEASSVLGENDTADNIFVYGIIEVYPKPNVEVRPGNVTVRVEDSFEVEIWMVNATKLYHFEFYLHYNASLLYASEVIVCDSLLRPPYQRALVLQNHSSGFVYICLIQENTVPPANGTGELARVTFEVTKTILYSWKAGATNHLHCDLSLEEVKLSIRRSAPGQLEQSRGEVQVKDGEYWFMPVPGDMNLDGMVDIIDLCTVARKYGQTGESPYDLDGDGVVEISDLTLIATNIGRTEP